MELSLFAGNLKQVRTAMGGRCLTFYPLDWTGSPYNTIEGVRTRHFLQSWDSRVAWAIIYGVNRNSRDDAFGVSARMSLGVPLSRQ